MIGFVRQRRPVQAVVRLVGPQPARAVAHGLVSLARPAVGLRVLERREVVQARPRPHDVVLLRAAEFEQPQLGFDPADAVLALGVAGEDRPLGHLRAVGAGQIGGDVVHADDVAVAKDRLVAAAAALPRRIAHHHHFARRRRMQTQFDAIATIEQEVVDEQLTPRADVDRRGLRGRQGGNQKAEPQGKQNGQGMEGCDFRSSSFSCQGRLSAPPTDRKLTSDDRTEHKRGSLVKQGSWVGGGPPPPPTRPNVCRWGLPMAAGCRVSTKKAAPQRGAATKKGSGRASR